jgi:hypothetical protein
MAIRVPFVGAKMHPILNEVNMTAEILQALHPPYIFREGSKKWKPCSPS